MTKRDFGAAVGEARKALDAGLSSRTDQRLRARLRGDVTKRRRVRWGRVGGVGAALALFVAGGVAVQGRLQASAGDGYLVVERSPDAEVRLADGDVTVRAGHCVLRDEAVRSTMQVSGPSSLRRLPDGVEVRSGFVRFDVDHDLPRATPVRVRVSHGVIEVLGTRFTVAQGPGGGEVLLHDGSIRFRAEDGRTRTLAPEESLHWPLPPDVAQAPTPPALEPAPALQPAPTLQPAPAPRPAPTPAPPPPAAPPATTRAPFDAEALLERVTGLRSRGRYEEAATALTEALREPHDGATDERLSFELGAILTRHLGDAARACAHWKRHRERFSGGRYEREIAQARTQLGCAD